MEVQKGRDETVISGMKPLGACKTVNYFVISPEVPSELLCHNEPRSSFDKADIFVLNVRGEIKTVKTDFSRIE